MTETLERYEIAKADAPYRELVDEECSLATPDNSWPGSLHTLDEHAWYIPTFAPSGREVVSQRQYVCSGCLRGMAQRHFKDCSDSSLCDPWVEAYAAERCDDCGLYRCGCPA